jgi:hypothetical protein
MMSKILWILLAVAAAAALGVFVFIRSHKAASFTKTTATQVEQDIRAHLAIGSPRDEVVAYLDKRGIGHTYVDEAVEAPEYKRTEMAMIRNASYNWPVRTDIQILFRFDDSSKLIRYSVKEINTGP